MNEKIYQLLKETQELLTEVTEFLDELQQHCSSENVELDPNIPRRCRIDLYTPAEKAISDAIQAVEMAGCDPLLTDAVVLLGQAKDKVADFVDKPKTKNTCNHSFMSDGGSCTKCGKTVSELLDDEHVSDVPTMNNTLTKFTLHPKVGDFGFIDFATILYGQIIGIDKPRLLFRVVGDQECYTDGYIIHTYDSACYVVVDESELNKSEETAVTKRWWEFWK